MNNADQMERVMYKAHKEGIVEELHGKATEVRTSSGVDVRIDFYESYIIAYRLLSEEKKLAE